VKTTPESGKDSSKYGDKLLAFIVDFKFLFAYEMLGFQI